MKKPIKRILSLSIILALMLPVLATGLQMPFTAVQRDLRDPFASMYDAGALIAEELEKLSETLQFIESDVAGMSEMSDVFIGRQDMQTAQPDRASWFEASETRMRTSVEDIGRLAESGLTAVQLAAELDTLELPGQTQNRIETIIDRAMTDRFIVRYRPGNSNTLSRRSTSTSTIGDVELITLPEKVNPKTFADELRAERAERFIEYIQPDFTLQLANLSFELIETEELVYEEPEEYLEVLEEIIEEELPKIGNDTPIIVAVIDTGIDSAHPMLADYMIGGWNFTSQTSITYDPAFPSASAHGTHIAGIIAQTAAQTGADVQILPLQVFDNGAAYTSDILAAIEYAAAHGASVINMSFGSIHDNPALYEIISNSNALFICAVGNNRRDMDITPSYPAAYRLPNLISVASVNADGGFSYFSNYSTSLADITALGRDVVSAFPDGGTGSLTGTSMSCPRRMYRALPL
jgi:hypothetical protein